MSSEWISVESYLPEFNKYVLCYTEFHMFVGYRKDESFEDFFNQYSNGKGWYWVILEEVMNCDCHRNDVFAEVTHWMTLPDNP